MANAQHVQELSHQAAKTLLESAFSEALFESFRLHTSYTLEFSRPSSTRFEGVKIPQRLALQLDADWRFGEPSEWQRLIASYPAAAAPDPEEPVQAAELVNLRWGGDSTVDHVSLDEGRLILTFRNARQIVVEPPTGDESWQLSSLVTPRSSGKFFLALHAQHDVFSHLFVEHVPGTRGND